jgi:hypothetical protein
MRIYLRLENAFSSYLDEGVKTYIPLGSRTTLEYEILLDTVLVSIPRNPVESWNR